ncbi:MAG: hypothetical protein E6G01_02520 [Actinobacteria bacterium]|nr:MAG: hypothetical protein E6G01_02520 [Actinomycetota bacterium]
MSPKERENGRDAASAEELHRQAAALNHLLGEIGLSTSEQTTWWNLLAQPELRDRTPTQAWLAGDTAAVKALVERWYEASKLAADRASGIPELLVTLRQKIAELDRRLSGSSIHRSA